MFTRSSPELKPLAPADADGAAVRRAPPRPTFEAAPKLAIGNDLRIIGQSLRIFSQGTLHRARCAA